MQRVTLDSFIVSGIKTRTNNQNEMDIQTSKIGELWQDFFIKELPKKLNSKKIYGVYYNYESDINGDFNVLAGVKTKNLDFENIDIKKGDYLVFKAKGVMPQIVIDTWSEVWNYFNLNKEIKRAYKTDFEKYIGENEIEIYIGLK